MVPPQIASGIIPLGEGPDDTIPFSRPGEVIENLLRHPRRVAYRLISSSNAGLLWIILALTALSIAVYGLVVGSFSGGEQLWKAPAKIVWGFFASAGLCFPSLYIFSCLSGVDVRPRAMFGILSLMLMLISFLLIGFAPVAWIFSQSTNSRFGMGLIHLALFVVAIIFSIRLLISLLLALKGTSLKLITLWSFIFILVALQMTTTLRPLIGTDANFLPAEKKFFLTHWVDEAAVATERK